ncbi:MAG: phosphatidylserine decarboxylase family protein [Ignavibacteriae bacterium]|jgi:phosphatidylserine decarboxylase|nr:phosphatidylserine decarboxylase family protein [Ignavibacteriota bacterium]NOG98662.1 phosphatidylserine decarboxylase family protein [Ignavibacteriota bacterium]
MITKFGLGTFGIVVIVIIAAIFIAFQINNNVVRITIITASMILFGFTLNFFRDPNRTPPAMDNVVISPADGKVIIVKEVEADNFVEGDAWQISIFMSPIDVHVNRIPIDGVVDYVKYFKGEYLVAFHDKADKRNERTEVGITSKYGKVFFTQVAGLVARRIVNELSEGDSVKMGKRFGMIKFGSRADVVVSKDWAVKVKVGDRVTAGETILYEQ